MMHVAKVGRNEDDALAMRNAHQWDRALLAALGPNGGEGHDGQSSQGAGDGIAALGEGNHGPVEVVQEAGKDPRPGAGGGEGVDEAMEGVDGWLREKKVLRISYCVKREA
jgi:hypothetical protein